MWTKQIFRVLDWKKNKRLWLIAALLFLLTLMLSIWWIGPVPKTKIILATGHKSGSYYNLGLKYQGHLEKNHLTVKLQTTEGSWDNYQRLLRGEVDAAFVQAGTYQLIADEDTKGRLRALAAIQWEPIWVFYRGEKPLSHITQLKGKRIAIGQRKSGIAALALEMLKINGIADESKIVHMDLAEEVDRLLGKNKELAKLRAKRDAIEPLALVTGPVPALIMACAGKVQALADAEKDNIDAAFFVMSTSNEKIIHKLLKSPRVQLLNFTRHLAYSRHFSFLDGVILGQGVIDLKANIPPQDIKMLATTTLLVCREDLHPQTVEQLLNTARFIHSPNKPLVEGSRTFPSQEGFDLPAHETATAYNISGESFITRLLPYWGVSLWFRLKILLIPLLVFCIPFFKMLPFVYTFRINWLFRRLYMVLREIEEQVEKSNKPEEIQTSIEALDNLKRTMEKVAKKIPPHLHINVYQWRMHVAHVREEAQEKLAEIEQELASRDVLY